jgi:hypothetical protein
MDTYSPDQREEDWDAHPAEPEIQAQTEAQLPRRSRRQFFNRRTAALGALITCAIGFYAGIRVEKGQLSNSSTALGTGAGGGARAALAARFARGGGTGAGGASGTGAGGASGTGAGGASGTGAGGASGTGAGGASGAGAGGAAAGGFGGAFAGGGAGGAGASFGTVASVKGKTIFVTDTSGNTVKVKVTPSTKITKNQSVSRHAIRPGDTIIVTGGSGSKGSTTAATITDSGNRGGSSGGTSGSGGSGSGSSGGGNSAVGSLFSSGG